MAANNVTSDENSINENPESYLEKLSVINNDPVMKNVIRTFKLCDKTFTKDECFSLKNILEKLDDIKSLSSPGTPLPDAIENFKIQRKKFSEWKASKRLPEHIKCYQQISDQIKNEITDSQVFYSPGSILANLANNTELAFWYADNLDVDQFRLDKHIVNYSDDFIRTGRKFELLKITEFFAIGINYTKKNGKNTLVIYYGSPNEVLSTANKYDAIDYIEENVAPKADSTNAQPKVNSVPPIYVPSYWRRGVSLFFGKTNGKPKEVNQLPPVNSVTGFGKRGNSRKYISMAVLALLMLKPVDLISPKGAAGNLISEIENGYVKNVSNGQVSETNSQSDVAEVASETLVMNRDLGVVKVLTHLVNPNIKIKQNSKYLNNINRQLQPNQSNCSDNAGVDQTNITNTEDSDLNPSGTVSEFAKLEKDVTFVKISNMLTTKDSPFTTLDKKTQMMMAVDLYKKAIKAGLKTQTFGDQSRSDGADKKPENTDPYEKPDLDEEPKKVDNPENKYIIQPEQDKNLTAP